jgi:hypothetical protein
VHLRRLYVLNYGLRIVATMRVLGKVDALPQIRLFHLLYSYWSQSSSIALENEDMSNQIMFIIITKRTDIFELLD